MSELFESGKLSLVRRNPWIMGLALSPLLITFSAIVAGMTVNPAFFVGVLHPTIFALAFSALAWSRNPRPRFDPTTVKANRDGVQVGSRFVPRAEIKEGLVVPARDDKPPRVRLRRRGWKLPMELQIAGSAEGRQFLHALGLDASQTVATFHGMSRVMSRGSYLAAAIGGFVAIYGVFMAAMVATHGGPLFLVALALFMLGITGFAATMAMPTRIDVGADGIVVSWFWRKRFLPYGEIASVDLYQGQWGSKSSGIEVSLQSGEKIRLPIANQRGVSDQVMAVDERIREAMDTYRKGGVESAAALLRREGRDLPAWIAGLRALGAGANADMRTAPLPRERLFRIVEDPALDQAARAAAAVALSTELDDEGRIRLKAAAEATAAPRLRIAIEKAADGAGEKEDAAIEAALSEIEAEEEKRRAAG